MLIDTSLSHRGLELEKNGSVVDRFKEILDNPYDHEKNPDGFVNLGTAENYVMLNENSEYLNKKLQLSPVDFSYGTGPWGSSRLRKAMAKHINHHFEVHTPVAPEQIFFANGVTTLCEMLGYTLFDPGDYVMLSSPIYQAFKMDFGTKAKVNCEFVPFGTTEPFTTDCISVYKDAIKKAQVSGKRIRAFILCNPHNPLGKCYTRDAIIGIMELCNSYNIHLIVDEIYALSVYQVPDKHAIPFTSCLSIDTDQHIHKDYLHHLYGFSKDFAAGGIRIGSLFSRNESLRKAMAAISQFGWSGNINDRIACLILEDKDHLSHFLDLSRKRLASNNVLARRLLEKNDIKYFAGANAGFFLWIDLRPWLSPVDEGEDPWKAEDQLTGKLITNQVYITNGKELSAEEPGWYRLIFAQEPEAVKEGVKRIVQTLKG